MTIHGETGIRYRLLDVLDFDSDRKCMTVVLQWAIGEAGNITDLDPTQPVLILCKGAETSILARVRKFQKTPLLIGRLRQMTRIKVKLGK